MAAKKEKIQEKDVDSKLAELKVSLIKQPTKRKGIKKEIARLLTMENQTKLYGENK